MGISETGRVMVKREGKGKSSRWGVFRMKNRLFSLSRFDVFGFFELFGLQWKRVYVEKW